MSALNYRVEHLGIAARDPAGLKDWYVQVLEAELLYDNGLTPPAYYLRLLDGSILEIYKASFHMDQTGDNLCRGIRHLALLVDSLDVAKQELMNRGIIFPDRIKPALGGGSAIFFQDAEGNLIHLVERAEGGNSLPGKAAEE